MSALLLALYAGVSLSFGAGGARLESAWVDPWLLLRSPGPAGVPWAPLATGMTFPALVWVSTSSREGAATLAHEWEHVRQVQALGAPVQFLGYLGTAGRAFEDYLQGERWPVPDWTGSPRCPLLTWHPSGLALWACRS